VVESILFDQLWDLVWLLAWTSVQVNPNVGAIRKADQFDLACVNLVDVIENLPKKELQI
jgi:hypothetical protein